jgi:hypothetical protein
LRELAPHPSPLPDGEREGVGGTFDKVILETQHQEVIVMQTLTGKLRWYPGDALVEIRREDLEKIADQCGVNITLNEVKGKDLFSEGEMVLEETGNKPLEEVTQTVVTISAPTEHAFRECLLRIIGKYRAPRTVYSTWGSDERAKEIFGEVADAWDGWF